MNRTSTQKLLIGLFLLLISSLQLQAQSAGNWRLGNPYVLRTDAAFSFSEDYVGLISGRNILFEPMVPGKPELSGTISNSLFPPEYTALPVSDAISVNDSIVLLFKGNVYRPVYKANMSSAGELGQWTGWPGIWNNQIDAALEWADGSYVFIKGMQYVSYDPRTGRTAAPSQMNKWPGWPMSWTGNIDAAFNGADGFLYFIRKGEILAMNAANLRFVVGYPKKLSGALTGVNVTRMGNGGAATSDNAGAAEEQGETMASTEGGFCTVGTPDPSKTGATGSIAPDYSKYFGGKGGKEFDDDLIAGTHVSEIRVWGTMSVTGIQLVMISKDGKYTTEGEKHGSTLGSPKVFKLDTDECITGIEGTYGESGSDVIQTLKFSTTKRKSQEFGSVGGSRGENPFAAKVPPEASFAGFAGRASDNLDAIALKYYIIQYAVINSEGKLIEMSSDKSKWSKGEKTEKVETDPSKQDPYIDSFVDMSRGSNATDKLATGFLNEVMPNNGWMLKTINLIYLDPLDIASQPRDGNNRPIQLEDVFYISITDRIESIGNEKGVYVLNGYNKTKSASIGIGEQKQGVKIFNSYEKYEKAQSFSIGGGFNIGIVAGSANYSHSKRQTQEIGRSKVMASNEVNRVVSNCTVDMIWTDPETGKKHRQKLTPTFRELIMNLPAPTGNVPLFNAATAQKNKPLPPNVERFKKEYMELIKTYGTHFVNNISFGGYYKMLEIIDKTQIQNGNYTQESIEASLSIQGSKGGGSANGGTGNSNSSQIGSSTSNSDIKIIASGSAGNVIFDQWSSDLRANPVPVNFSIYPLSDVMTKEFFPFDDDIEKKKRAFENVMYQYLVDNSIPVLQGENGEIQIYNKKQLEQETVKKEENKNCNVEITVVSMDIDGADGEGNDNFELYGWVKLMVTDNADNSLLEREIWRVDDNTGKGYDPTSITEINQKYSVQIPMGKLPDLSLKLYGKATDYDVSSGDDKVFNLENRLQAVEVSPNPFAELKKPGDTKTVSWSQGNGGDDGKMTFNMRITVLQ